MKCSSSPSSSLSVQVQRLRQLMSLDLPKVALTTCVTRGESSSSPRQNSNSNIMLTTTKTTRPSPGLICTCHGPHNQEFNSPVHRHYLRCVLELDPLSNNDEEGDLEFVFCSVCLATVGRLLTLQEEVDNIKTRIKSVLNLRRRRRETGRILSLF